MERLPFRILLEKLKIKDTNLIDIANLQDKLENLFALINVLDFSNELK